MRGDVDNDNEPCSTGSPVNNEPPTPPCKEPELSPLRLALSSSNPILTASLNRPPVIGSPLEIDLTKRISKFGPDTKNDEFSSELYANLLMQLSRGHAGNEAVLKDFLPSSVQKTSAFERNVKLKCQPSFQCPVCQKRFQRHIAMSAHFQNEHISQASSTNVDMKMCRLCSFIAQDIVAIRQHLLKQHNIDLENPAACLADPRKQSNEIQVTSSQSPNQASTLKQDGEQDYAKDLTVRARSRAHAEETEGNNRKRGSAASNPVHSAKKQKIPPLNNNTIIANDIESMFKCSHCCITFPNQTLYFLHRGFHSEKNPWTCNGCGLKCTDLYDFNTHLVSDPHQ